MREKKVIAVDFDGTLCEHKFPEIGKPKVNVINFVKEAHKKGHKIIIWTCRTHEYVEEAIAWLKYWGVPYDEFNENISGTHNCRKVLADIYLDDRSLNVDDLDSFNLDTLEFDNSEVENDVKTLLEEIAKLSIHRVSYVTERLPELDEIANKYGYEFEIDTTAKNLKVYVKELE